MNKQPLKINLIFLIALVSLLTNSTMLAGKAEIITIKKQESSFSNLKGYENSEQGIELNSTEAEINEQSSIILDQAVVYLSFFSDQLEQNQVLIYPLILEDTIEMIIVTSNSVPVNIPINVSKEELSQTIVEFRQELDNPYSDPKPTAQKLYNWLIKPLENTLNQVEAKTIIYAPDGILRYIPLGALYDGEKWLIEKYAVNNITATSLTDLDTQPQPEINLLACAYGNSSNQIQRGENSFNFAPLPFTELEIENIAQIIPNTTKVIGTECNHDLIYTFNDYNVIHLATYGVLVSEKPEESFILLGDGSLVTFSDIEKLRFDNVDLVVLSGSETALGGNLGTGAEILGLGYVLEKAGARAVIFSLWTVDDGATQVLMTEFYHNLTSGKMTKAQALRQAQITLINKNKREIEQIAEARGLRWEGVEPPILTDTGYSHPYYWSPFILIGNGL